MFITTWSLTLKNCTIFTCLDDEAWNFRNIYSLSVPHLSSLSTKYDFILYLCTYSHSWASSLHLTPILYLEKIFLNHWTINILLLLFTWLLVLKTIPVKTLCLNKRQIIQFLILWVVGFFRVPRSLSSLFVT